MTTDRLSDATSSAVEDALEAAQSEVKDADEPFPLGATESASTQSECEPLTGMAADTLGEDALETALETAVEGAIETAVGQETGLRERDEAILGFERQWWKYAGAKEQAIKDLFDMSATRYYQALNALIDTDEALMHDPMLVKRLRRMRASRQRARSARRLGVEA